MDFRELNYLVSIAKHQSVTKAGQELYVSQPTLSKFIQNVEKELGQPLFRRLGNKFALTYMGEIYISKAKEILDMKRQLDQELADIVQQDRGELKIAFPIMRGTYALPCTLPVFSGMYPQVRIKVRETNSAMLEDLVLSGEIDIAFFNLPIRSPHITYEILSHEEVLLIMYPDHPIARRAILREEHNYPWMDMRFLKEEWFILQEPGQRTRQIADKLFKDAGFEPNIIFAISNILAMVQLAADGYGMSLVAEKHLHHINLRQKPACFSVGEPHTTTDFVAAYRRGIYLPQYAKDYIKIVKEFT